MNRSLVTLVFASSFVLAHAASPQAGGTTDTLKVGGSVLPPVLVSSVEPKYPRPIFGKPKPSHVVVGLIVRTDGLPSNLHVVTSGGAPFDKAAMKAVSEYRFKPSTQEGKPVPVEIHVDVQFRVF